MHFIYFVFPTPIGNTPEPSFVFPTPVGNISEPSFMFPMTVGSISKPSFMFPMIVGNISELASRAAGRSFYFATHAFNPWMTADENPACSIAFSPRMV